ncbi:MAG: S53 family peptidase [Deltaproteobacteria bacterium]|nr:S53 family peptidase [Deltaproteobacteria bacterium]
MTRHRTLLLAILLLLLAPAAAFGEENVRASVERHLMRLERGAVRLGPTADDALVRVELGFGWRDRAALDQFVRAVNDPHSPQFQRYLTPREFARRFAPPARQVAAAARYLRRAGLRVVRIGASRLSVVAEGPAARVARALDTGLIEVRDQRGVHTVTAATPVLPAELGAQVVAVGAATALQPPGGRAVRQALADAPFDPAEIGRLYGFDALHAAGVRGSAARASTIAIATAFDFDPADLTAFWRAHGIARELDSVETIAVEGTQQPPPAVSPMDRMETTLDVEWASAMAPQSRVLVYSGGDALSTTFLRIYDRIVTENRAAVLSTSWGRCETDYPQSYLNQLDAIFTRAAAQGITVVAAAGDRGAFDCGGETPSVSSPASHPYVLAVGGTGLFPAADGFEELAWPGSGGGTSARWKAPQWQMHPSPQRTMADVAFNADPASGYLIAFGGGWYAAGGTSVGAPIWAALVALANQARGDAGRAPLGLAAPQLCELALAPRLLPAPFADITGGDNGAFSAAPGWDFPTGWGTPHAAALVDALAHWTPDSSGVGGLAEVVRLVPVGDQPAGAVRLRFQRRCLTTDLDVHARGLQPGRYTLWLDATAAASFDVGAGGEAILSVPHVDLRGERVQLTDGDGDVCFARAGDVPPTGTPGAPLSVALKNTGMVNGASGTLLYRGGGGREQLTVRTAGLPAGAYDVRLGSETIGTLKVVSSERETALQFDSLGLSGTPLRDSPLCKSVMLVRGGSAYLRSAADALAPGGCSDGQRRA